MRALDLHLRLEDNHLSQSIFVQACQEGKTETRNNEQPKAICSSKEVGKQSSELRTNRIVRLYSMKGGVRVDITSQ